MKPMAKACALAVLAAVAQSGCVAIPCGTETFTTEYPAEIRTTAEKADKTYAPSVAATAGEDGSVEIGLFGEVTTTQPRAQHYNRVSVTKRKRLAVGLYTDWAEKIYHPQDALVPTWLAYVGNGRYRSSDFTSEGDRPGSMIAGEVLNACSMAVLPIPFMFLRGLFGPFEHDRHYLGKILETKKHAQSANVTQVNQTHDSRDLDLLAKFPAEDRQRMGAWCWMDNDGHPQNTFWLGFTSCAHGDWLWPGSPWPWPGVSKYCTYVVHEPVELERTTSVAPETTVVRGGISGPYGVFLQVPEIGLARTLTVPRGEKTVRFTLAPAESGATSAQATVRFLPPSGGLEEAWDEDARALLERVEGQDFPLEVELPLPRMEEGQEW